MLSSIAGILENKQIKNRDKIAYEIWEEISTIINSMNGKYERKTKNDK